MSRAGSPSWSARTWDDGAVVFDRRLGHTHALNPITATVLQLMSADPPACSRDQLIRDVTQRHPDLGTTQAGVTVDEAVAMLSRHGLVSS